MSDSRKMIREKFKKSVRDMKKSGKLRKDIPLSELWQRYQSMEVYFDRITNLLKKIKPEENKSEEGMVGISDVKTDVEIITGDSADEGSEQTNHDKL